MIAIPIALAVLAVLSWLGAVVHALMLVRHRRDDVSILELAFQGHRFFSTASFKPEGHPIHRRFVLCAGAFGLCIVLGIASGIVVEGHHGHHR